MKENTGFKDRNNYSKNWLEDHINVTQWDHRQTISKYGMLGLKSLLLQGNPKFEQLRNMVVEYNEQVDQYNQGRIQSINHAGLRHNFIASLFKMLTEMCLTTNLETQAKYLEDVHKWANEYQFTKKERPVTATTRATRPTTAATRPASGISMIVPLSKARYRYDRNATERQIQEFNKELMDEDEGYQNMLEDQKKQTLPARVQTATSRDKHRPASKTGVTISTSSNYQPRTQHQTALAKGSQGAVTRMSAIQKHDFTIGARTLHPEYQIPSQRLKEYKRKNIDLEADPLIVTEARKKELVPQSMKLQHQQKKMMLPPAPPKAAAPPSSLAVAQGLNTEERVAANILGATDIGFVELPPSQPAETNPVEGAVQEGMEGDEEIGIQGQEDLKVQDVEEVQVQEVVDKLGPKTKAYNNDYDPISMEHPNLLELEQKFLAQRNKEIYQIRGDEEMIERAKKEWAKSKARIEKEGARKRESRVTNGLLGVKVEKEDQNNKNEQLQGRFKSLTISHPENMLTVHKLSNMDRYKDQLVTYSNNFMDNKVKDTIQNNINRLGYTHSRNFQSMEPANQKQVQLRDKLISTSLTKCARPQSCYERPKNFASILVAAQEKVDAETNDELVEIKECLAKNKVAIENEKLRSAITSVRVSDNEGVDQVSGITGVHLLHNPFFKVAKKKKKKKK